GCVLPRRRKSRALSCRAVDSGVALASRRPRSWRLLSATRSLLQPASASARSRSKTTTCGRHNVRFTPESGHSSSQLRCPLCAKSGHYAAQQSIALIGACTAGFSPVVGGDCKAPAHSHHILPLVLSVLPHPARGR